MGLFRTFKRALSPSDDFWYRPVAQKTVAGVPVSEEDAFKYLVLASCVGLISGDIAKLPLILYQENGAGKKRVTDHPVHNLMHNAPNAEMNGYVWRESAQSHLLLWGNTYHVKEYDKQGQLIGLWPLNPAAVKIERRAGQLVYIWYDNEQKRDIVKKKEDVFHVAGMGFNGVRGISMVQLAREAIGLGLAEEEYQARFVGSGTHPAGVLEMDGFLGEKGEKAFKKSFADQYQGLGRSHSVMVLEGGLKYKPISMSMEDAQFLESRNFQKLEICGFYRVPPHKVAIHGANSNYSNLEQENQSYVDSNLSHWVSRWESALNLQLLSDADRDRGLYLKFLMQALLRGDMAARAGYHKTFWNMGLPLNRILEIEDMNPVEGGDVGLVQMNLMPLKMAQDMAESMMTEPEPELEPPPEMEELPEESEKKMLIVEPEKRITWDSETRGIAIRDRITRRYRPLFLDVAQTIVNREGNAIKKKLGKRDDFDQWLAEFYKTMPNYIRQKFGPTFTSFALAIQDASFDEIGGDVEIDRAWIPQYIETYALRHVSSSEGQIRSLYGEGQEDAIEQRVDEWAERRPEKIANNETVRMANGMFSAVAFAAAFAIYWRIRGKDTCPYCRSMNGKRIKSGDSFVNDGEFIKLKGQPWMKINGTKSHPPLHAGCDCFVGI